jgi:Zn-dependent protease with chaperone function
VQQTRHPGGDSTAVGRASLQRRLLVFGAVLLGMLALAATVSFSPAATLLYDLALTDDLGEVCLLALARFFSPLHHVFEALMAAGVAYACVDRVRAWLGARRLLSAVQSTSAAPGSPVATACAAAGLDVRRLRIVPGIPVPALTVGAFRPTVLVSGVLENILSRDELVAVLAHEGEHVRQRDPLRLSLMRTIARALFWIPAFRSLEQHLVEVTELKADRAAARRSGIAAASAIIALVREFGRVSVPALSSGISQHDFLAVRVRVLAGQNARLSSRATPASLAVSLVMLLALWVAAVAELHDATHKRHLTTDVHGCIEHNRNGVASVDCDEATSSFRLPSNSQ